jgi:hypothetical protein
MAIQKQEKGDPMMKRLWHVLITVSLIVSPAQSLAGINLPVLWSQGPDMNNENAYLSTLGW